MNFTELAIYALALACIARSLMAFTNPQAEYALNGLRHTTASKVDPSSEPIYMLGTWELSVGILLLVQQMNGNSNGVTTLLLLMSLYKAGIAILLWKIGSGTNKVAGNVATTAVLVTWAASRS
ncbi:gluconate 5-dehydrogenase [Fusarium pseudoanthophilum]|uniref:Gluconate 5-dehydrogenase n=1 Tax=Fusarium pseudoanthophilum TaxID=48495 RepID=A0A8H5P5Y6_9HYPO|nr:gluconate 5-dehydrogenase [Fusarium pseudoanthophilum]